MFRVTPAAAEQIQNAARQGGTEELALRLVAHTTADGSIDYKMGFDEATDEDICLKIEGVDIVLEPEYAPLLDEAVLDFVQLDEGDKQFIFQNPKDSNYKPPQSQ